MMASSVVVDMQGSFAKADGTRAEPPSVPEVASVAIVAVEGADHVGGSVHAASLAVADAVVPTIRPWPSRRESS
jgi:hypothetical protein